MLRSQPRKVIDLLLLFDLQVCANMELLVYELY